MSVMPNPESHLDKTQRPHGTSEKKKKKHTEQHDNDVKMAVLATLCPVVIL